MRITTNYIQEVINTLPISYYLGRKLNIELDENATSSYFELVNEKIVISVKQLQPLLNEYPETITNQEIENDIRCMLYHEVSHALLSNKLIFEYDCFNSFFLDIINIFEDERIETICDGFYKNVNFKQFVKRINKWDDKSPRKATTDKELFYQIVRYRYGKKELVDEVQNIIYTYRSISFDTSTGAGSMFNWDMINMIRDYVADIKKLYYKIANEFESQKQENNSDDNTSQDFEDLQKNNQNKLNQSNEDEEINEETNKESSSISQNEQNNSDDVLQEVIYNTIDSIDKWYSSDIKNKISQILSNYRSYTKQNGSAITSYSGVFNPRLVGQPNSDYKYFVRQNRLGNVKQFSKLKLNLFIDRSGSFIKSEDTVNKLLNSLINLEKSIQDFEFDLITCGHDQEIVNKNDRKLICDGGNYLSSSIYKIFKNVQQNNAENINIILFDGDANPGKSLLQRGKYTFDAFDKNNCFIISDYANETYIRKSVKQAKVIYTNDYANELENNVVKALNSLIK